MIEIAAKLVLLDEFVEIAVGGDDDAHIDLDGFVAADALDFAFFEDAEQLGLHGQRHVADFVEEEGAAVGLLELADVACRRRR